MPRQPLRRSGSGMYRQRALWGATLRAQRNRLANDLATMAVAAPQPPMAPLIGVPMMQYPDGYFGGNNIVPEPMDVPDYVDAYPAQFQPLTAQLPPMGEQPPFLYPDLPQDPLPAPWQAEPWGLPVANVAPIRQTPVPDWEDPRLFMYPPSAREQVIGYLWDPQPWGPELPAYDVGFQQQWQEQEPIVNFEPYLNLDFLNGVEDAPHDEAAFNEADAGHAMIQGDVGGADAVNAIEADDETETETVAAEEEEEPPRPMLTRAAARRLLGRKEPSLITGKNLKAKAIPRKKAASLSRDDMRVTRSMASRFKRNTPRTKSKDAVFQCIKKGCKCGNAFFSTDRARGRHMDLRYPKRFQCKGCSRCFHRIDQASVHVRKTCKTKGRKGVKIISATPHWLKKENKRGLLKPKRKDPLWEKLGYDA